MPLDIGIGLILGVILNSLTGIDYRVCLLIGLFACLLPDLDYLYKLLVTKRMPHSDHRDGLHFPLLFIPIIGIFGYLIDPYIGLVLAMGALIHFIHDSIGVGWGVKWLYPFDNKSHMFLYRAGLPTNKYMPKKMLYSWTDLERKIAMEKYGDPKWISNIYFKPHIFGLLEYSVFFTGLLFALYNA